MAKIVSAILHRAPQAAALALAVALAGCQTAAHETVEADPPTWGRFDCQPRVEADFDRAKTVCVGRADAAAVAGTASIRPGYSVASAIVAGVELNSKYTQINLATGMSCMAEFGYRLSKRSEVEALCPAPPPPAKRKNKAA